MTKKITTKDVEVILSKAKASASKEERSTMQLDLVALVNTKYRKHQVELAFTDAVRGKYGVQQCAQHIFKMTQPNLSTKK